MCVNNYNIHSESETRKKGESEKLWNESLRRREQKKGENREKVGNR